MSDAKDNRIYREPAGMTTGEKAIAILRKILDKCNEGKEVSFKEDWGGYSATIYISDANYSSHTHFGSICDDYGQTIDEYVNQLYSTLHGGPGLSWSTDFGPDVKTKTCTNEKCNAITEDKGQTECPLCKETYERPANTGTPEVLES